MPFGDTPGAAAGSRRPDFMMPQGELITSALSNKGNPTGYGQDNTFRVREAQEIRIFDNDGNLLFSGAGPEAAKKAVAIGQNLSDTLGRKAGWTIQTGDQYLNTDGSVGGTRWNDVANEKTNKSTLGTIASVVGTALPIAVGFIPGLQGVGAVLASAGAGGVGAALRGQDILKGIAMGGLSAAGGQYLGDALKGVGGLSANAARAIGTGIGSTTGGVVTGQNFGNAVLGGVASGGLSYLGGELLKPGARTTTGADTNVNAVNAPVDPSTITVTGTRLANLAAPSFTVSGAPKTTAPREQPTALTPEEIIVTAGRAPNLTSSVFSVPGLAPLPKEITDLAARSTEELPPAEEAAPTDDEIILTAQNNGVAPGGFNVGAPKVTYDFSVPEEIIVEAQKQADTGSSTTKFPDEIEVTAKRVEEPTTGSSVLTVPGLTPLPKDIVDAAEKATDAKDKDGFGVKEALALLGLLGGIGGGGSGGTGTGTGTGKLQPTFSAKLPTPGEGGSLKVGGLKGPTLGAAGTYSARPVTDWYRYGMGPAMDIPAGTDLSGATSPYAGYGPGTLGQETFKAVSGVPEQPTGMSHGGPMGYARGSSRESFAVNGPGTGRSDDIPAVLSDGEYVIDAETVALLGDGSSKAGAKRLDELRVNLRKHKGRNLAKGKFSVNAKRPEKYLSGGRT